MNPCLCIYVFSQLCFRNFSALIKTSDHKNVNFHSTVITNNQGPVSFELTYSICLGQTWLGNKTSAVWFLMNEWSLFRGCQQIGVISQLWKTSWHSAIPLWHFADSLHLYRQPRLWPMVSEKRSGRESYLCHNGWQEITNGWENKCI